MGRSPHAIVTFLCGVLFKKNPPAVEDADEPEDKPEPDTPTSSGRGDAYADADTNGFHSPRETLSKPCSPDHPHHQPLPPPPGNGKFQHHMRTLSWNNNMHHRRSNSGVAKLMSSMSMSMRVLGGGGGGNGGGFILRDEAPRQQKVKMKYFKREDSVWKKTIILGERCRVPNNEDDDINLHDEKGNKVTTYHPKTYSGLLQYSRQNSSVDRE